MQSNVRQFTLNQDKLLNDFVKILSLTAAGLCLPKETNSVKVISGLPVGYLKRDHQRFIDILTGSHKITYNNSDGSGITKRINILNVKMMPQPLGSIFNILMNDNGQIVNKDLVKKKIGLVDIGFKTTDYTIFDNLQYIERGSLTMDTGISKSLNLIANKLRQESGVSIELYRLHDNFKNGVLSIKGKEYNINNLREKVYKHAASSIASDINRIWSDDWDMEAIILTGGGCRELAAYLQPLIDGNVLPIDLSADSRLNNVKGYYKFANHEWGQSQPPEK